MVSNSVVSNSEWSRGRLARPVPRSRPRRPAPVSGAAAGQVGRAGGEDPPPLRPLVGRKAATRTLEAAVKRAAAGHFQVVELVGEPGIGKTRLLSELTKAARDSGFVTLSGRAAEFEQELPLAAFVDTLDDHLDERADRLVERLPGSDVQALAAAFPGLPRPPGGTPGIGEDSGLVRHRLFRAVRRLLEALALPSGLVVTLDDLQWADQTSIDLLGYIFRHPPSGRIVLAVAHRVHVHPRLTAMLADLDEGVVRHLPVPAFDRTETDEFLGSEVAPADRQWLHENSGGNPFYLEVLARMEARLPTGLGAERTVGVGDNLPAWFRGAVAAEISSLPASTSLVARSAAVVGDEFEPGMVAASAAATAEATREALDDLVARDLIWPATPGRFEFRHPLVRHAVYASADAAWLLGAHGRVAAFLARVAAPAALRAHHVARSAGYGDRHAAATLAEAAGVVAGHAPAAAAHWLEVALRVLPDSPDVHEWRLELLTQLAEAQSVSGCLAEGRDTGRRLLDLLASDDHARRTQAARFCAIAERLLGRTAES